MLFYTFLRGVVPFPLFLGLFLWNDAHKSDNVRLRMTMIGIGSAHV